MISIKRQKRKSAAPRQGAQTQQLMGIEEITDNGIITPHGRLVFFCIEPTNISVLSESSVAAKIYALIDVLKGKTELEFICLNSRESFESIKQYIAERRSSEPVPQIRKLLEQDARQLDRMQVQMATAREYMIIVRLDTEKETEILQLLTQVERSLKEHNFRARRADREEIKRILAVYFEQNVTTEKFEDFDGERWVVL